MRHKSMLVGLALCGLALALPAPAGAQGKVDITGKYAVEGSNPGGGVYKGTAEITKKGDVYQIAWVIGGNETYEGVGILQGEVLAVSFASGGSSGVVAYKVEKGPKLVGQWATLGSNKILTETLTRAD